MTIDERSQLIEDIKTSSTRRRDIAERAELDKGFDMAAAWEVLTELDRSIAERIGDSDLTE